MRAQLTVVKTDDTTINVVALVPDFVAWERRTKRRSSDLANGVGMEDLAYLAWHALNRTTPQPDFDSWINTVAELEMGAVDTPKVGRSEASTGS